MEYGMSRTQPDMPVFQRSIIPLLHLFVREFA